MQIWSSLDIAPAALRSFLISYSMHSDHFVDRLVRTDVIQANEANEGLEFVILSLSANFESYQDHSLVVLFSRNDTLRDFLCELALSNALSDSICDLGRDALKTLLCQQVIV